MAAVLISSSMPQGPLRARAERAGSSDVCLALVPSPVGLLKVAARGGRLLAIGFGAEAAEVFLSRLGRRLPGVAMPTVQPQGGACPSPQEGACPSWMAAPAPPDGALINELTRQLRGYFAGGKRGFFLPLSPPGTPFQQRVWAELARIPFGERRTYAQVAEALGGRGLARAVGNACGANPLPIVIPCHRVVASNGGLGGFSGGLAVKRLLLELEGAGGPASRWGR